MIDCYVINLDRSLDRWRHIETDFAGLAVRLIRVSAVDASQKPELWSSGFYRSFWFRVHLGRSATAGELGCYSSHLKVLRMFLDSGAERALICEDDVVPERNLVEILEEVEKYAEYWNLLRLAMCRKRGFHALADLPSGQTLGVNISGFAYAPAYLIDRKGAEFLLKNASRMSLPWDLMVYRGWGGMSEMSLVPGPFQLGETSYETTIVGQKHTPISPFMPTFVAYRLWARARRYTIQWWRLGKLWKKVRNIKE
ncbi:MAG: glycosyltransferase family 25 protein [Planctomycetia bacterium]|nr:glycosyltransferase family 25 protein [Planctomycetia bacterium]